MDMYAKKSINQSTGEGTAIIELVLSGSVNIHLFWLQVNNIRNLKELCDQLQLVCNSCVLSVESVR